MLFKFASLLTLIASTYLTPVNQQARLPLNYIQNEQEAILAQEIKPGPTKNPDMLGVKLTAKSALVLDQESGQVLFEKNGREALPMASLTKIMTAVTILDQGVEPDATAVIGTGPLAVQPAGADMGLVTGEKISIYNLLRGLLMSSSNDAAIALAEVVSGSEEKFVEVMNQKVEALGLKTSQFKNTHGLDQEGHYSSAYDLAVMTRYALDKQVFREIMSTPLFIFETNIRKRWVKNTNKLLDKTYLDIIGGKTGFTDNAGRCLMEAGRDSQGNEIIVIILDSQDRWQEAKGLIDWTFRAYTWP